MTIIVISKRWNIFRLGLLRWDWLRNNHNPQWLDLIQLEKLHMTSKTSNQNELFFPNIWPKNCTSKEFVAIVEIDRWQVHNKCSMLSLGCHVSCNLQKKFQSQSTTPTCNIQIKHLNMDTMFLQWQQTLSNTF